MNLKDKNLDQLREIMENAVEEEDVDLLNRSFSKYIEGIIFSLTREDRFYAIMIMELERRIDYNLQAPAAVTSNRTDFILLFNPLIILSMEYDLEGNKLEHREIIEMIKGILIHECLHIANRHLQRAKLSKHGASHDLQNIAMDVAINQHITQFKQDETSMFMNLHTIRDLIDDDSVNVEPNKSYEYYLNLIMSSDKYKEKMEEYKKQKERLKDLLEEISGNGFSNSSSFNENFSSSNDNDSKPSMKETLEEYRDIAKGKLPSNHSIWDNMDAYETENMGNFADKIISSAAKTAGNMPGHIEETIRKLNKKPKITWMDLLKNTIGSISFGSKRTMLRRNRRQWNRLDLPGETKDKVASIVVAIDTSASMGEKELAFAFNEIFEIAKHVNFKLTIIECDMEINKVYEVSRKQDVDMNISGRGGTRFTPVFKYIRENKHLQPDVLIYFTDGFGEPEIPKEYSPRGFNVIWVLTDRVEYLSLTNPYSNMIKELKVDEESF